MVAVNPLLLFRKTNGLPHDAAQEKNYTYYWQLWHHNWDDSDVEMIKNLCHLQGKKVLEAGCGDGRITLALSTCCSSITGIDISELFIKIAGERLKPPQTNIQFETMDAQQLTFANESYDVVLFPWVLQMVNDPLQAVKEAFRVLKPGGQLLVIGLLSNADYDKIIGCFVPHALQIDPHSCYEKPIAKVFGDNIQAGIQRIEQTFNYFFENTDIAYDAFVFALDHWYSTRLDTDGCKQLKQLLDEYAIDNRVRLEFPAYIYSVRKAG